MDLPTEKKKDRKAYADFSEKNGSGWFCYDSIFHLFTPLCNAENAHVHIKRLQKEPCLNMEKLEFLRTDKQFGDMELFIGKKSVIVNAPITIIGIFLK